MKKLQSKIKKAHSELLKKQAEVHVCEAKLKNLQAKHALNC
jgi:hypothetical protein